MSRLLTDTFSVSAQSLEAILWRAIGAVHTHTYTRTLTHTHTHTHTHTQLGERELARSQLANRTQRRATAAGRRCSREKTVRARRRTHICVYLQIRMGVHATTFIGYWRCEYKTYNGKSNYTTQYTELENIKLDIIHNELQQTYQSQHWLC